MEVAKAMARELLFRLFFDCFEGEKLTIKKVNSNLLCLTNFDEETQLVYL